MLHKEYRERRLECVRRDIFHDWELSKHWHSTMSKQRNSTPGFNFNPSDTFFEQNLNLQRETETPPPEARSEVNMEPTAQRPQNINEGTESGTVQTSLLTNTSHPLNNHQETASLRTPSMNSGFARNFFSGISIPITRAGFNPSNARAHYEAWRNRNRTNTMEEYARNLPARSTDIDEVDSEEESESEGVCEMPGEMPAESTAIGQSPEFHESFGSPIQWERPTRGLRVSPLSSPQSGDLRSYSPSPRSSDFQQQPLSGGRGSGRAREVHQTSREVFGFDDNMAAQSTAIGQLPEFHESFGSSIQRERPIRGVRVSPSPSPQSANLRSYSPSPNTDDLKSPSFGGPGSEIAQEVQRMMSFEKYQLRDIPPQSTAVGQLPQFHESFGSPIRKEKPIGVPRVPHQFIRPNVSKLYTGGKWGGTATPRSDDICESPSPMSDDLLKTNTTVYGGVHYPEARRLFEVSPHMYGVDNTMPAQSTAVGQLPQYHESFGSPIARERPMRGFRAPQQYLQPKLLPMSPGGSCGRSASPRSDEICESPSPQSCDLGGHSRSPQSGDVRRHSPSPMSDELLKSRSSERLGGGASPKRSYQTQCGPNQNDESFMERFDKAVEKELERYRIEGPADTSMNIPAPRPLEQSDSRALDSITSSIEIIYRMKGEQDTELTEAVEKLAKAEATVLFQGAVEAAEIAAASVPPEFAEEAAAASARAHAKIYNAELTNVVQESVPGIRPIEIVGYVGVTRPKKPLRP